MAHIFRWLPSPPQGFFPLRQRNPAVAIERHRQAQRWAFHSACSTAMHAVRPTLFHTASAAGAHILHSHVDVGLLCLLSREVCRRRPIDSSETQFGARWSRFPPTCSFQVHLTRPQQSQDFFLRKPSYILHVQNDETMDKGTAGAGKSRLRSRFDCAAFPVAPHLSPFTILSFVVLSCFRLRFSLSPLLFRSTFLPNL